MRCVTIRRLLTIYVSTTHPFISIIVCETRSSKNYLHTVTVGLIRVISLCRIRKCSKKRYVHYAIRPVSMYTGLPRMGETILRSGYKRKIVTS